MISSAGTRTLRRRADPLGFGRVRGEKVIGERPVIVVEFDPAADKAAVAQVLDMLEVEQVEVDRHDLETEGAEVRPAQDPQQEIALAGEHGRGDILDVPPRQAAAGRRVAALPPGFPGRTRSGRLRSGRPRRRGRGRPFAARSRPGRRHAGGPSFHRTANVVDILRGKARVRRASREGRGGFRRGSKCPAPPRKLKPPVSRPGRAALKARAPETSTSASTWARRRSGPAGPGAPASGSSGRTATMRAYSSANLTRAIGDRAGPVLAADHRGIAGARGHQVGQRQAGDRPALDRVGLGVLRDLALDRRVDRVENAARRRAGVGGDRRERVGQDLEGPDRDNPADFERRRPSPSATSASGRGRASAVTSGATLKATTIGDGASASTSTSSPPASGVRA